MMHEEAPQTYSYPVPRGRPFAWITWLLVGSTVAVFLLQLLCVHLYGDDIVANALSLSPEALHEGCYWTLITYAWAHAVVIFGDPGLFWFHIASNMILLICLGPALEELLGAWRYLGLYLGGAMVSGLVWLFFNPSAGEGIIGASGAVFALIAAAGMAAPRARLMVYLFYILPIRMTMWFLALLLIAGEIVQIVFNWMPEIAHSAHLGGAAFGFLYVLILRRLSWRY